LRPDKKLEHAQASLELMNGLLREQPNAPELTRDLALSEYSMAVAYTEMGRYEYAIQQYRSALTHSSYSDPMNVALFHKRLGALLLKTNDRLGGLREYQAATELDEARVRENPESGRARMDLSFDYSDVGLTLASMGRTQAALDQYFKVEKIRQDLSAADPRDERALNGLVSISWRIAQAYANKDRAAAERYFQKSIAHAEQMIEIVPDKNAGKSALADAYYNYGIAWKIQWSSCAEARPKLIRALELYRQAGKDGSAGDAERLLSQCPQR
jgi:tetratricopeptide (TPR) repeat protein